MKFCDNMVVVITFLGGGGGGGGVRVAARLEQLK
jgi:hypothetical protein